MENNKKIYDEINKIKNELKILSKYIKNNKEKHNKNEVEKENFYNIKYSYRQKTEMNWVPEYETRHDGNQGNCYHNIFKDIEHEEIINGINSNDAIKRLKEKQGIIDCSFMRNDAIKVGTSFGFKLLEIIKMGHDFKIKK